MVPNRPRRDDEWRELFELACRDMAPYGVQPSPHLIDQLLDIPTRRWLTAHFVAIADVARAGVVVARQRDGRVRRRGVVRMLATMRSGTSIDVVLDEETLEIVTVMFT
jgi:hypothetical protein